MKKLLLLAAFGLLASPAFAQGNSATSTQSGSGNDAEIDQVGMTNTASADQDGTNNLAFIRQIGDTNASEVVQDGSGNLALSGTVPGVDVLGDNNNLDIFQYGDGNQARLQIDDHLPDFSGDDNDITVTQGSASDDAFRNSAEFYVRGDNNDGTADQSGDDNLLRVNAARNPGGLMGRAQLDAHNSTFDLSQSGDLNDVYVYVGGDGNSITTSQSGSSNSIGTSYDDGINVYGDGNTVAVSQMSDFNTASAMVEGSGNTSTITQN